MVAIVFYSPVVQKIKLYCVLTFKENQGTQNRHLPLHGGTNGDISAIDSYAVVGPYTRFQGLMMVKPAASKGNVSRDATMKK